MIKAEKILVIQTAFLGDAILSIPLLKSIRSLFPKSTLVFVCRKGFGDFFLKSKMVENVIEVDKNDGPSLSRAFQQMKEQSPDLVISPHRSFRTAVWAFRLGAGTSVGFRSPWSFFGFKKAVKYRKEKHDVLRQLSLLEPLGYKSADIPRPQMSLQVEIVENQKYADFKNFIAISPGSQWNTKRWTREGFIGVGQKFSEAGKAIIILGSASERSLGEEISHGIPGAVNLCGETDVVEMAQILKRADLLVCNDSGTMHVSAAMGTPVVCIFGPTVPAQGYAPWTDKARIVETVLSCRPCGAHGHMECPIGTHACMKNISVDTVFKVCKGLVP